MKKRYVIFHKDINDKCSISTFFSKDEFDSELDRLNKSIYAYDIQTFIFGDSGSSIINNVVDIFAILMKTLNSSVRMKAETDILEEQDGNYFIVDFIIDDVFCNQVIVCKENSKLENVCSKFFSDMKLKTEHRCNALYRVYV